MTCTYFLFRRFIKSTMSMSNRCILSLLVLLGVVLIRSLALKAGDCEVCIATITKFASNLTEDSRKNPKLIEDEFRKFCKTAKNKEERFCYYLGGLEDSATGILKELSGPLKNFLPADKICEKLKKKDAQVCDLRFGNEYNYIIYKVNIYIILEF